MDTLRSLIDPLATCLENYEDRSTLLFTGHSAGAATASLLYAHVLSRATSSLVTVANSFTNIHCILFACPPISVYPLQRHRRDDNRSSRSLFLSFLNDGEPIIKAYGGYVMVKLRWTKSTPPDTCADGGGWTGQETAPFASPTAKQSNRFFVHSGSIFLLELDIYRHFVIRVKNIDNDKLKGKTAMWWRVHSVSVYKARIESCEAGQNDTSTNLGDLHNKENRLGNLSTRMRVGNLTSWLLMVTL